MRLDVRWLGAGLVAAAMTVHGAPDLGGAPPPKGIELIPLGVYETGIFDEGAVEIAAYDPDSQRAFLTFADEPSIQIVDLSNPAQPAQLSTISLAPFGGARTTSVAVRDGVVAAAVPKGVDDTAPGSVLFFTTDGAYLNQVMVGTLPDMITFSPNGRYVLTANEGQPNQAYTFDPPGSVSIIDMAGGAVSLTAANVTTVGFSAFNNAPLDPSIRIFGPGATVAQDLEPEYLAVSHDSRTAWVTLQENNAIAILDLQRKAFTALVGLGFKNHALAGQGLDGSRDDGTINIATWPVKGMYQPDAIAAFEVEGRTYLVTANEGDVREYAGLNAAGDEKVEIEDITLDPAAFPNGATLQHRVLGIGRLFVTRFLGNTDGDPAFEELYTFGARSFSIWSEEGGLVFDSGEDLEQITAATFPQHFNASNTNNTFDNRSDDKGPEPEGVTVARLFGRQYIFVMLERIGGVVVYEVIDPKAPRFVQYINTRDFTEDPEDGEPGDLGAESGRVIPAEASPTGEPLFMTSNEVSGTLRLFRIVQKH